MKKLLGLFFIMMLLVSGTVLTTSEPDAMHTMEGTWELQNFHNWDGEVVTTAELSEGYRQVKMYYNGKVMWSRTASTDTKDADGNNVIGRFGFGTYKITDTELIETIEYGDQGMMRDLETLRIFTFQLKLTDSTYSQITLDEEGNPTFSENYNRID